MDFRNGPFFARMLNKMLTENHYDGKYLHLRSELLNSSRSFTKIGGKTVSSFDEGFEAQKSFVAGLGYLCLSKWF